MVEFRAEIFAICLGVFLMLTYIPYLITSRAGRVYGDKFIARNWLAVVFPTVLTLYILIVDGIDLIMADITKYIIMWAIAQGVIFSLTETAQKIGFRKGDWSLDIETRKNAKEYTDNKVKEDKDVHA